MAFEWDPVTFTNLILCIVIVILGIVLYRLCRDPLPLYIGTAFGLFGVSHALTLAGFKVALAVPLIIIRTCAYLLVIYALVKYLRSCLMQKEAKKAWVDFFNEESGEIPEEGAEGKV